MNCFFFKYIPSNKQTWQWNIHYFQISFILTVVVVVNVFNVFNVVSAATVFVFVVVVVLVADYLTVVCKTINISRIYIISINFMYIDVYSIYIRRLLCSSAFFLLWSLSMLKR